MEELTIKAVTQLTGLTEFTLRAWEKRYGAVKPKRNPSGRRVYQFADVERLRLLKSLSDSGQSIGQIATFTFPRLKSLYNEVVQHSPVSQNQVPADMHVLRFLECVERMDLQGLMSQLRAAQLQMNTRTFLIDVISPFLSTIGRKVSEGKLDIFHEHAASSIVRNILSGILYMTEQSVVLSAGPPIIFSTPQDDLHEFGILICAILAMLQGSKVLYLGPNLPVASIVKACETVESSVVVFGTSAPTTSISEKALQKYFTELAQDLPASTQIWVGGSRARELKGLPAFRNLRAQLIYRLEDFDRLLRKSRISQI